MTQTNFISKPRLLDMELYKDTVMERRWKLSFKALACHTHNAFFTRHEKVIPA